MKFKRITALTVVLVLLFVSSGCTLDFFSVESLMSPPSQSGKNGEVEAAFKKLTADKSVQLKTPASGQYQSSFILFDINSDGVEEAVVFYTDTSVDASVRLAFLEYVNDAWVISADVKGAGNSVYDIAFSDLNADGIFEIFVGWSLYENKTTRIISAYSVSINKSGIFELDTIANEYYSEKSFVDFNGDGVDELVLVYIDDTAAVQKSFFRCFDISEKGELVKFGEINIDGSVSSVLKIQSDTVVEKNAKFSRLFIDCLKTDNRIFTEMIYWDNEKSAPVRAIKKPSTSTLRSSELFCRDIDGDGILEIPVYSEMHGDPNALTVKKDGYTFTFTMIKWLNVYGDKSEGTVSTVFNPIDSYFYRITRIGDVTVRYNLFSDTLLFCEWDETEKVIKNELFSIFFVKNGETSENKGEELYSAENGKFYYNITEYGEKFGITDEGVISSFIILN